MVDPKAMGLPSHSSLQHMSYLCWHIQYEAYPENTLNNQRVTIDTEEMLFQPESQIQTRLKRVGLGWVPFIRKGSKETGITIEQR